MELTERKKKVLRSVVDLYIRTAEPVGSKAITELPDMKYSSATIRNEMAELTAMGYLEQPHTSAGRIPSAAGYRLYVDELMMDYRLSIDETKSISSAIEEKMQRVDKMVEKVAKLVSQATDLPAISAASRQGSACVKRFDLILAGQGSFILVLMLGGEQVVNKLIKLPVNVSETDLKLLSAVLNASMTDIPLDGFTAELMEKVMRSAGAAASLVPVILDFTQETLKNSDSTSVAVTGQARLLSLPEYRDVDKAQRVMDSIDEEALANLPAVIYGDYGHVNRSCLFLSGRLFRFPSDYGNTLVESPSDGSVGLPDDSHTSFMGHTGLVGSKLPERPYLVANVGVYSKHSLCFVYPPFL